jgi:hypothetical protein
MCQSLKDDSVFTVLKCHKTDKTKNYNFLHVTGCAIYFNFFNVLWA